jgi:hypothetical protein
VHGVPVPPPLRSAAAHAVEVANCRAHLPPELQADPRFGQKSPYWAELFKDEHEALCHSTSHGQMVTQWNTAKHHQIWDQNTTDVSNNVVKPELEDSDASSSIEWDDVELSQEKPWEESPPPPPHDPGIEKEWPGTMAAYRVSVEAVIDDD